MQNSMQAGMVPPPLPGINFLPPSLPHTPQAPATPIAFPPFPPQFTPQPAVAPAPAAPVERVQEVMDSDREDGEVSDAEASSRTPAGIAMRQRYPEPPRSAPQPAATPSRAEEAYNPDKPSAGQTTPQVPVPKVAPQQSAIVNEVDQVQQQREEAKQFIRLLNANNIGYHALAKENIDVELLRGMYRSMNLPSEPEPIPLPRTNGAAAKLSTETQPKAVPSVSTNIVAASAASAAASPVDRKDYLARLQAAKLARQSGPAKASPPQKSPPATTASPAPDNGTPQATMTPTRKPPATDEQKARQTELIKQRLEALKAQSKQAATQKPGPSQPSTQPPPAPSASASAPQTPATSFSNIPGLFMNGPSSSGNGASTPSRQPQAVPQKRPAPSDTSMSTPRGSVTPYNRQYGQSPHPHHEDSMIIEVSDDESNGSDMDIDEDQGPSTSTAIRQAPVSIPGFPPRQALVPAAASAVSTPGPQTPATLARTGELSTKEQELAALKLTLKKKLAEQKRIKEAAEAASAAASAATAAQQETPSKQAQLSPPARAQEAAAPATVQAGTSATDSSRDRKRRRRTEIQEQLPTLDDEIASNEAEMARLAKDLKRLKANNERIMQDKQRLTKELEDLGIDTEGMSHADMRATKDEIERAMSPENEAAPQTDVLPSASPSGEEAGAPVTAPVETGAAQDTEMASTYTPPSNSSQPAPLQYGLLPGLGRAAPRATASTQLQVAQQPVQEQIASPTSNLPSTVGHLEPPEGPDRVAAGNDRASATPMDDDEDFYSPPSPNEVDVNIEASVAEVPEPQVEQAVASAPSPSEEGEVEMSESSEEEDEEEYEPEEPIVEEPVIEEPIVEAPTMNEPAPVSSSHQAQPSELQVEQSQSIGQSQVSTEDEEAYEPPDVDEEMTEVAPVTEVAQAETVVPEALSPGDADDGAMDIATSSSEESDDSDSDSDEETQSELGDSESQTHAAPQDVNIADDLAPELQPDTSVAIVPATERIEDVSLLLTLGVLLTPSGTRR